MGTRANKKRAIYDNLPESYKDDIPLNKNGIPQVSLERLKKLEIYSGLPEGYQNLIEVNDRGVPTATLAKLGRIEEQAEKGETPEIGMAMAKATKAARSSALREISTVKYMEEVEEERARKEALLPEIYREMGYEIDPETGKLVATEEERRRRQQESFLQERQLLALGYSRDPDTGEIKQLTDEEIKSQLSPEQQRQYEIYKKQQERVLEGLEQFGEQEKEQYQRYLVEAAAAGELVPEALGLSRRGLEFAEDIFARSEQAAQHLADVRGLSQTARGELASAYAQRAAAEDELYGVYDLMKGAREDYGVTAQKVQDLLSGKGEVSAGLEYDLEQQEMQLRESLRRRYGPNYENTTGGMQALAQFKTQSNIARDTSRREQLPAAVTALETMYGQGIGRGTSELYSQAAGAGLGELYGQGVGRGTMELYQQTLGYGAGAAAQSGLGALSGLMDLSTGRLGQMREAYYGGPQFGGVTQYGAEAGILAGLETGTDRSGYYSGILSSIPNYGAAQTSLLAGITSSDVGAAQSWADYGLDVRQQDYYEYMSERQQTWSEWVDQMNVMLQDKSLNIEALQGTAWGAGYGSGGGSSGSSAAYGQAASSTAGAIGTIISALIAKSDKKLKQNIKPITDALSIIMKLKPSQFEWKATQEKDYGHIAQEVEKVLPEAVHGDDLKWLTPLTFIGLLVAGLQEVVKRLEVIENANI